MNKIEISFAAFVLLIDIVVISLLSTNVSIEQIWIKTILFSNGAMLGNILYYLVLQDWLEKKLSQRV
jgi:uncharacterized membrane protein